MTAVCSVSEKDKTNSIIKKKMSVASLHRTRGVKYKCAQKEK
jgi:hypothetical protein